MISCQLRQKLDKLFCLGRIFGLKLFAQDHADRVLKAMNSEALEERLQVEFVSEYKQAKAKPVERVRII